jgi:hypothetical protein
VKIASWKSHSSFWKLMVDLETAASVLEAGSEGVRIRERAPRGPGEAKCQG